MEVYTALLCLLAIISAVTCDFKNGGNVNQKMAYRKQVLDGIKDKIPSMNERDRKKYEAIQTRIEDGTIDKRRSEIQRPKPSEIAKKLFERGVPPRRPFIGEEAYNKLKEEFQGRLNEIEDELAEAKTDEEKEEILEDVHEELTDWNASFLGIPAEKFKQRKRMQKEFEKKLNGERYHGRNIKFDL